MKVRTLDELKRDPSRILQGAPVAFQDKDGRVRTGYVRIRNIRCGKKSCSKCPHHRYAYAQAREGNKVTERYIGKVK